MDQSELRARLEELHAASYGWALRCCVRHPEEVEDILQTVYLKVLDGRARYDGRAAFKTWLFAVIRRTAADERRRHWLRRLGLVRYGRDAPPAGQAGSPAETLHLDELQAAFREALARLPRRQQEVLHLVFYQELSLSEAAGVMGVSVGAARQHYERGKQRLRQERDFKKDFEPRGRA